jgi:hypothetical protein
MREPYEVWNSILHDAGAHGVERLSPDERAVMQVNVFLVDLENGGLAGALYNVASREAEEPWQQVQAVATAFHYVGARDFAAALRRVYAVIRDLEPTGTGAWSDVLASLQSDHFRDMERVLETEVEAGWEHLAAFTRSRLTFPDGRPDAPT